MVAAYATSGGSFRAEAPRVVPNSRFARRITGPSFVLHPDGDRFALVKPRGIDTARSRTHMTLVFNFLDELRRLAPHEK